MPSPVFYDIPQGQWTQIASNSVGGLVHKKSFGTEYYRAYREYGEAAPTTIADGVLIEEGSVFEAFFDRPSNIYLWADKSSGRIRFDEGAGARKVLSVPEINPPVDSYFLQSVAGGDFVLDADTVASTIDTLNYDLVLPVGHGLNVGDEILLLDPVGDVSLFAVVLVSAATSATIDRPIDHVFPAAVTLGRKVTSDLAVNGSVTPQIFTIRAGTMPFYLTRFLISMTHSTAADDSTFGDLSALTRGLVFRAFNGFKQTVFNFKTNGEIKQFCYDVSYTDKAGPGLFGTSARISFGSEGKHGTNLKIFGATTALQWIVQDDLTGLGSLRCVAEGRERIE